MRPVNLIPPEDRRGDHAPLRAGVASYAIVAVLALALVGVVLVVLTSNDISEKESQIASLEARKAQAEVEAADLAPYGKFAELEEARSVTVTDLAQSRFDWERVLNELALVIPRRVTFENLTATIAPGVAEGAAGSTPTAGSAPPAGPSLVIVGCAKGQQGTARLIASLKDIDGVTRVGMQSSELGDASTEEAVDPTQAGPTSCQTRPSVAKFQVTVAFDAVELPTVAPPVDGAAPAAAPSESGVPETAAEQEEAVDSAAEQTDEADNIADAVGVGN
jgi:Tfp pilus assembly protein PilN